ncbi:MAG: hypothetical protein QOJ71_1485 [Actinomycetota bacterium]|nr:hypothetical protein [Actinomycetota bacterium]
MLTGVRSDLSVRRKGPRVAQGLDADYNFPEQATRG